MSTKSATPKTFLALSQKIQDAKTSDQLRKWEDKILTHYNNNTISTSEFRRLDLMIFERLAKNSLK